MHVADEDVLSGKESKERRFQNGSIVGLESALEMRIHNYLDERDLAVLLCCTGEVLALASC
jgi:hypothetical protein